MILAGYVGGVVARGVVVGVVVTMVSMFFTDLSIHSYGVTLVVFVLTRCCSRPPASSTRCMRTVFDDISIVPTFVLTPLTYLGGVFYSISLLPPFWRTHRLANPLLLHGECVSLWPVGVSDIAMWQAFAIIVGFVIALGAFAMWLLRHGGVSRAGKKPARQPAGACSGPGPCTTGQTRRSPPRSWRIRIRCFSSRTGRPACRRPRARCAWVFMANAVASMLAVLLAPVLGVIADRSGRKKGLLLKLAMLGVLMSGGLFLVSEGYWLVAAGLYVLGVIGFTGSNVTDAMLLSMLPARTNWNACRHSVLRSAISAAACCLRSTY